MDTMTSTQISSALEDLPGWRDDDGAIVKAYELESFREAIAFVNRLAELAEAANHHPDLGVSYRTVTVTLTTHSAGGVTQRDVDMAARVEQAA